MFTEKDLVICINDQGFIKVITTIEDKSTIGNYSKLHPKKDEVLIVDEILGEYVRFDQYDDGDSFNWFHSKYFTLFNPLLQTIKEDELEIVN